jgi:hypothetical protein
MVKLDTRQTLWYLTKRVFSDGGRVDTFENLIVGVS